MTDWTLHTGDCLTAAPQLGGVPDRGFDVVITDPPYSERVHKRLGAEGRSDGSASRAALDFEFLTTETAHATADQLVRVSRRWILIFCDELSFGVWVDAIERAGGEYVRKGTWVKIAPMPQMSGDRPTTGTEEIVIAHAPRPAKARGRLRWNGGGKAAVYFHNPQDPNVERVHQAQKPIALMQDLVRDFTEPGELICDPYAGSGTTGVAATLLGRRFVGWERNAAHAAAARARLESARELRVDADREQIGLFR